MNDKAEKVYADAFFTLCLEETPVLNAFMDGRVRDFFTYMKTRFIFQILYRNASMYLRYLRIIDKKSEQVEEKLPWSVRKTESDMIRCPESWQLDFQPRLKWDYCHGLELGAMLDVYDTYGDKKIRDYAIAYADTMVHEDGSITAYKLTDYSLDRINSGKV